VGLIPRGKVLDLFLNASLRKLNSRISKSFHGPYPFMERTLPLYCVTT